LARSSFPPAHFPPWRKWRNRLWRDGGEFDNEVETAGGINPAMAPPRTHATSITTRLPPGLMSGLDKWIADQPEPRPLRVEAIRRLLERGLAPAPAPSEDTAELRRQLIRL
jgi:hypothetical protein